MPHFKKALVARTTALSLLVLGPYVAAAEEDPEHVDLATRWKVDDTDPMASIPSVEDRNKDPLEFGYYLQDMLFRAEGAYRKQDWRAAVKYYKPLSVAVPTVARSYSRMCDAYARLGESARAIESCRTALGLSGAKVIDHVRYVDLLLRKPSFGASDADDVRASLTHLREHASKHPQALPSGRLTAPAPASEEVRGGWNTLDELAGVEEPVKRKLTPEEKAAAIAADQERLKKRMRELLEGDAETEPQLVGGMHLPTQIEFSACRLAVRTGDAAAIPACTARLREYKIPEQALLPFLWAEAVQHRDQPRAAALLEQARQAGAGPDVLASMLGEQEKAFGVAWTARLKDQWAQLLGLATLALSGLLFFGKRRSARARLAPTSSSAI